MNTHNDPSVLVNIAAKKNNNFTALFKLVSPEDDPIKLSSYTTKFLVFTDDPDLEPNFLNDKLTISAEGELTLDIAPEDLADVIPGAVPYELQLIKNGVVKTWIAGLFEVYRLRPSISLTINEIAPVIELTVIEDIKSIILALETLEITEFGILAEADLTLNVNLALETITPSEFSFVPVITEPEIINITLVLETISPTEYALTPAVSGSESFTVNLVLETISPTEYALTHKIVRTIELSLETIATIEYGLTTTTGSTVNLVLETISPTEYALTHKIVRTIELSLETIATGEFSFIASTGFIEAYSRDYYDAAETQPRFIVYETRDATNNGGTDYAPATVAFLPYEFYSTSELLPVIIEHGGDGAQLLGSNDYINDGVDGSAFLQRARDNNAINYPAIILTTARQNSWDGPNVYEMDAEFVADFLDNFADGRVDTRKIITYGFSNGATQPLYELAARLPTYGYNLTGVMPFSPYNNNGISGYLTALQNVHYWGIANREDSSNIAATIDPHRDSLAADGSRNATQKVTIFFGASIGAGGHNAWVPFFAGTEIPEELLDLTASYLPNSEANTPGNTIWDWLDEIAASIGINAELSLETISPTEYALTHKIVRTIELSLETISPIEYTVDASSSSAASLALETISTTEYALTPSIDRQVELALETISTTEYALELPAPDKVWEFSFGTSGATGVNDLTTNPNNPADTYSNLPQNDGTPSSIYAYVYEDANSDWSDQTSTNVTGITAVAQAVANNCFYTLSTKARWQIGGLDNGKLYRAELFSTLNYTNGTTLPTTLRVQPGAGDEQEFTNYDIDLNTDEIVTFENISPASGVITFEIDKQGNFGANICYLKLTELG